MTIKRLLLATLLLLAGERAIAQTSGVEAADGEWASYRDAYKLMIRFEKYGKPKHLIQQHYQVAPKDKGGSLEGVRLTLAGPSIRLDLPLDATGRAVFPYLKAAYDENARLVLNRKANQYTLQPRISIVPRADGIYDATELRAACEQVLQYLRHVGKPSSQDSKCAGVRFSFAKSADPVVRVKSGEQNQATLAVQETSAFTDDPGPGFKTVTYQFADWPEKGQIVMQSAPVAIAAVFN